MRVTFEDDDSAVTVDEPMVSGPKVILYDHEDRPLKRQIGFRQENYRQSTGRKERRKGDTSRTNRNRVGNKVSR